MIIRNATSVRKILRNGQFIYNVIRNSKLYYYYISESFIELEYHYGINDEIIYPSDTLEVKDGKIISFKVPVRRLIDGIVGQYDTINQRVTYNEPQKNSAKPLRGGPIKTLKYHRLDLDNNQYTFIRDTSSVFHRTPYSFIIGNYFLETSQENTGYEFISLKEKTHSGSSNAPLSAPLRFHRVFTQISNNKYQYMIHVNPNWPMYKKEVSMTTGISLETHNELLLISPYQAL